MGSRFKSRDIAGNFVYRRSLESLLRHVETGELVYATDAWGGWTPIGMAHCGSLLEGEDYVRVSKIWRMFDPYGFWASSTPSIQDLLDRREIVFPAQKCGLTNLLIPYFSSHVIDEGPRHFRTLGVESYSDGAVYHFVVTEDGARILQLATELRSQWLFHNRSVFVSDAG